MREPAFWVVKRNGSYLAPACETSHRLEAAVYDNRIVAEEIAAKRGGRVVAVYVTMRKVPRGHSWSWACKRLLEGKRVRRRGAPWWLTTEYGDTSRVNVDYGSRGGGPYHVVVDDMRATDWEAAK